MIVMTNKEVIDRCIKGTCEGCPLDGKYNDDCDFYRIYECYPHELERLYKIGAINRFWQNMEYGMRWSDGNSHRSA